MTRSIFGLLWGSLIALLPVVAIALCIYIGFVLISFVINWARKDKTTMKVLTWDGVKMWGKAIADRTLALLGQKWVAVPLILVVILLWSKGTDIVTAIIVRTIASSGGSNLSAMNGERLISDLTVNEFLTLAIGTAGGIFIGIWIILIILDAIGALLLASQFTWNILYQDNDFMTTAHLAQSRLDEDDLKAVHRLLQILVDPDGDHAVPTMKKPGSEKGSIWRRLFGGKEAWHSDT